MNVKVNFIGASHTRFVMVSLDLPRSGSNLIHCHSYMTLEAFLAWSPSLDVGHCSSILSNFELVKLEGVVLLYN